MTDNTLIRTCISELLRLATFSSKQLRRRCDNQWCNELRYLSKKCLITRLKYIIWWTPLRTIVTAYNRGLFRGQCVLTCVYNELERRKHENLPCVRDLVREYRRKYLMSFFLYRLAESVLLLI